MNVGNFCGLAGHTAGVAHTFGMRTFHAMRRMLLWGAVGLNLAGLLGGGLLLAKLGGLGFVLSRLEPRDGARGGEAYEQRLTALASVPRVRGETIFLGDSHIDRFRWAEHLRARPVRNFGIGGDRSDDVLRRVQLAADRRPEAVVLLVGTNDLKAGMSPDETAENVRAIVEAFRATDPGVEIVLHSVPPSRHPLIGPGVEDLNARLRALASREGCVWFDLHGVLADQDGGLPDAFSVDGVHLSAAGYALWLEGLRPVLPDPADRFTNSVPSDAAVPITTASR